MMPPTMSDLTGCTRMRLNKVKELRARISTVRSDEQTEIGYMWVYDPLMRGTPM